MNRITPKFSERRIDRISLLLTQKFDESKHPKFSEKIWQNFLLLAQKIDESSHSKNFREKNWQDFPFCDRKGWKSVSNS